MDLQMTFKTPNFYDDSTYDSPDTSSDSDTSTDSETSSSDASSSDTSSSDTSSSDDEPSFDGIYPIFSPADDLSPMKSTSPTFSITFNNPLVHPTITTTLKKHPPVRRNNLLQPSRSHSTTLQYAPYNLLLPSP